MGAQNDNLKFMAKKLGLGILEASFFFFIWPYNKIAEGYWIVKTLFLGRQ